MAGPSPCRKTSAASICNYPREGTLQREDILIRFDVDRGLQSGVASCELGVRSLRREVGPYTSFAIDHGT